MSDTNANDIVTVDVNTDDLDAFSDLFHGKAEQKIEVETPADDTGATDEDEAPEEVVEVEDDEDANLEAEDDDVEAKEEVDEVDDILKPKPKKKQSVQERINEITRRAHEAERREADALRRLAAAEAERNSPKEPTPTPSLPTAVEPGAPDADALHGDGSLVYPLGEFDPAFIRDLTRFTIQQENERATAQRFEQEEANRAEAATAKLQQDWAGKLSEVEKVIPDLRPTIATLEAELSGVNPELGVYLAQTIMGMDVGPQVLYYLANNVDEAQKIIAAGPVGATLALGRLEQKIQMSQAKKANEPTPARVSAAPQPPVTTRGTASRAAVSDDTDDLAAFEAKFFKKR